MAISCAQANRVSTLTALEHEKVGKKINALYLLIQQIESKNTLTKRESVICVCVEFEVILLSAGSCEAFSSDTGSSACGGGEVPVSH